MTQGCSQREGPEAAALRARAVGHVLALCIAALATPVWAEAPTEPPTPDGGLGRVFGVLASIAFVFGFGRQVRNWWKRRNRQRRLDAERRR